MSLVYGLLVLTFCFECVRFDYRTALFGDRHILLHGGGGMTLQSSRGLMLYLRTLETALEDNRITDDEMSILNILAKCLGLPIETQGEAFAISRGEIRSPINSVDEAEWAGRHIGDATCYQSTLIAALDDEVISDDEMAILDCLRRAMGLQPNEHALVEEAVRAMIVNHGDERLMTRLEAYQAAHPYQ